MTRIRRRFVAWLAIFAVTLGALAPTVSRAMGPRDGGGVIEVCSAAGTHWIRLDRVRPPLQRDTAAAEESGDRGQVTVLEYCPYCFSHAGAPVALPAAGQPLFASPGGAERPHLVHAATRPPAAWPPSHPRAPPSRA